jgi:hypothetical protein
VQHTYFLVALFDADDAKVRATMSSHRRDHHHTHTCTYRTRTRTRTRM